MSVVIFFATNDAGGSLTKAYGWDSTDAGEDITNPQDLFEIPEDPEDPPEFMDEVSGPARCPAMLHGSGCQARERTLPPRLEYRRRFSF